MALLVWLVTPALIATVLVAALPLYDPAVRWSRRLRNDIQIAGGLPDGPEKELLNASLERQARRLRLYREAFKGRHQIAKWGFVAYFSLCVIVVVAWPPNLAEAGADNILYFGGAAWAVIYATLIGRGFDIMGRTPLALIRRDRVRRHDRRVKRLDRLDKVRAAAIADGRDLRPKGSRLGLSTQVDALAEWVRTPEAQSIARNTGFAGAGLSDDAVRSLREKGQKVPNPYR